MRSARHIAGVLALLISSEAHAISCDPPNAANEAAQQLVIPTLSSDLVVALTAQTEAIIIALQGSAAQISANIRGSVNGFGMLIDGLSNQEAQRNVQNDQMAALVAHQYSTPLCQAATSGAIATQQAIAAQTVNIQRAQANAFWTSGLPGGVVGPSVATIAAALIQDRQASYCAANDSTCPSGAGARPNGDRMLSAVLALPHLDSQADRDQAARIVNNVAGPVPVPALTAADLNKPGGQELYVRRGGWETVVNYARDLDTEILLTRREKNTDPTFYNQLAQRAGLPAATGQVSTEDMDQMRYVLQFSPQYSTNLATLSGDALLRQIIALQADYLRQGYETQKILEKEIIAEAVNDANDLQPKLAGAAGHSH